MYTPAQVAKRANIHPNTVRKWASEYAALLSPQTTGARLFSDEDVQIFCTIAALRRSGMPPADVAASIRDKAPTVVDVAPNAQDAPQATQAYVEPLSSTLVPYIALQSRVEALERRVESNGAQLITGIVIGAAITLTVVAIVLSVV